MRKYGKSIYVKLHLLKGHKTILIKVCSTMGIASIVPIQLDREDMAWTYKVLVISILAITMAETISLPPVKFLKDFAIKYQRSSIVMNLPKEIPRIQVLKR